MKKSKPLALFKVPDTSRGQFQGFRGHFKVVWRSKWKIFLQAYTNSMLKLANKKK